MGDVAASCDLAAVGTYTVTDNSGVVVTPETVYLFQRKNGNERLSAIPELDTLPLGLPRASARG
jgi:hypothetical protein